MGAGEEENVHRGQMFTKVMPGNNHFALAISLNSFRDVLWKWQQTQYVSQSLRSFSKGKSTEVLVTDKTMFDLRSILTDIHTLMLNLVLVI